MARYRIPTPVLPGFELIDKMELDVINKIASLIEVIEVGSSISEIARIIEKECQFKETDSKNLVTTIISLVQLKINDPEVSADLTKQMAEAYKETAKGNEVVVEKLSEKLDVILHHDGRLWLTQRALKLQRDYEKIYSDANIISDIRPIYNKEMESPFKYALIVHQLKINYEEAGELKTVIISLDDLDLIKLKNSIIRAEKKENIITESNFAENITFIKFKEA